jgi:uncharacterized repeat protein (TIGR01451 family)
MRSERWAVGLQQALRKTFLRDRRTQRRRASGARPCLEVLEQRLVPSVLYDEAVSGDLSNNQAAPTPLTLALGTNSVKGTVGGATGSQDWLTVHVPSGKVLSSLVLATYVSSDSQGFMGVQAGTSFVGNPGTASPYLGYAHYGTGATNGSLPPTDLRGADLLPIMGNTSLAAGSQGFTPPLTGSDYTFLIQQLGASTTYQFDFVVSDPPVPDLVIAKSHTGSFRQGDPSDSYTVVVTNSGTGATSGTVTATDTLPTGLTPTAANSGTVNGWSVSRNGQTVTATRSDALASGAHYPDLPIVVAVAADAPASVTNTATVSGGGETNTANDSADDPTTITQVADLVVAKSHADTFTQGDASHTYKVVVSNSGPGPTSGTVTVTDTLPTGLTPTADNSGTVNGWTYSVNGRTITATRGDALASGDHYPDLVLTVAVAANAPASVTNTATVSGGGELNTANDRADDPTTIVQVADLVITKSHAGDFTQGDATDTYKVVVSNSGPGPTSGTVTVTDTLPTGLTPTADNSGTVNGWTYSVNGRTITATRGDALASGDHYPDLVLTVAVAADAPASVTNTATVSGGGELNTANDTADDPTTILVPQGPNQPPVNTLPAGFAGTEDTALPLTGISVADPDAASASVKVTFAADSGALTLSTSVGGGVSSGQVSGNGTGTVVITAPLAAINATLASAAGLTYTPAANFNGGVSLTMTTDDLGHTGTGGALTDTDGATITLSAVNDAPVNTLPPTATTPAGTPLALTGISVSDVDAGPALVGVVFGVTNGTLAVSTSVTGGVGASEVVGNGSGNVVLFSTLARINSTLAGSNGLVFTPAPGFAGTATLTLVSNDLGNSGSGGFLTDSDTEQISVTRTLDHFTVAVQANVVAGVPFTVTVTARDHAGAVVGDYAGTVNVTKSDLGSSVPATAAFTAGVATFSATLETAGTQTLRVADALAPSLAGSGTVLVVAAAAAQLAFQQQPATTLANAPFPSTVSVVALDAFGNLVTNDNSDVVTVRLQPNSAGATLSGTAAVKLIHGVATFPTLQLNKAGNGFRFSTSAPLLPVVVSDAFDVAAVASFGVTTVPTTVTAGTEIQVTVQALDSKGAVVTNYAGTIHITSTDPQAALPADATLAGGTGTFRVTLKTAGSRTVSAADLVKSSITGTFKKPLTVTAAAVSALTITGLANPSSPSMAQTVSVSAVDAFGNVNAGYRGTVTLTSTDPAAVLPHSTTFVAKDAGKHPFGVTLKTAGLRAVTASDGVLSVSQANILVTGASATVLQQQDPDNAALTALVIIGTGANDAIDITPTNPAGTQLQVRINRGQPVTFTPTGHVLVYGLGGNDTIRLLVGTGGVKVSLPVVIDAGAGNDTVDASGGTGDTIVLGGAGNDNLTGGSGNNMVIGGQGADAVHGGGNDILTGESTALDTNLAALLGLMAEWRNTAASPLTRARHLSGSLSGGLNGPYVLNGSTVMKDASVDQLFDSSGSNWFVYTGSGSLADVVKDLASGDVLSPL